MNAVPLVASALLLLHLEAGSLAQVPAAVSFEVASVKPNTSGDGRTFVFMPPGGRLNITNAPLREIIRLAYQVQDFQLVDAPEWAATARFDIVARAPTDPPPPTVPDAPNPLFMMLRALLADRFKLAAHTETRELPVYALVMARADRRPGPALTPTAADCAALAKARPAGTPPSRPGPGDRVTCGLFTFHGRISGGSARMKQLADILVYQMRRIVIDRTGLEGAFDFTLAFLPDQMPQALAGGAAAGLPTPPTLDPSAPPLMTALEEQLGLKLESTKAPVDVLVIDSVRQPTPD